MEDNKNKNVMMAGRVESDTKEFVDKMYKDVPGETYASAMRKLIECYSSRPVEEDSGIDFSGDIESIEKSLKNVKSIMSGIKAKADDYVSIKTREVNNRLAMKDEALERFKEATESRVAELEAEIELLKNANDTLTEEKEDLVDNLKEEANKNSKLSNQIEEQKKVNEELRSENKRLNLQVANNLQEIADLSKLKPLKEENDAKAKRIVELEGSISLKDKEISLMNDSNTSLNKELDETKKKLTKYIDELTSLNNVNSKLSVELTSVNKELSFKDNEIVELKKSLEILENDINSSKEAHNAEILKLKEELIDAKEDIREVVATKYEAKIDALKEKYEKEILTLKEKVAIMNEGKSSPVKETKAKSNKGKVKEE